jgi:hypothetical protein
MASNIDPSISLGGKPPPTMTLPDMLNLARGAQAFQREREILPELVEQARIGTGTARTAQEQAAFTLSKDQNNALMGIVGGFRNDPRIASGNPDTALSALDEIKAKAVAAGIPRSMVERIAGTATNIAINDPKRLPQYFDNVIQSQAGAEIQQGLQTPELTTSGGAPALFRRATGTLEEPTLIKPPQAAPQDAPQAAPQAAPRGVTPEDMTAPISPQSAPSATQMAAPSDPGFALRYPVRPAGDIRPFARGEEPAQAAGETTRALLLKAQADVPRANRSVGEIIRIADELEKDIGFTTGKPADLERAIRVNFGGEARYQELSKDIAQVQMALNQATGIKTDQQAAQVAEGTGNATYDPQVLIKIARRLRGELVEIDARATGAQKFVQKYGDSNLPEFLQQWSSNSDLRIFESMAILRDIRDPKAQKEALDKILPKTEDELAEFQQKYRNIRKLTQTGTLR